MMAKWKIFQNPPDKCKSSGFSTKSVFWNEHFINFSKLFEHFLHISLNGSVGQSVDFEGGAHLDSRHQEPDLLSQLSLQLKIFRNHQFSNIFLTVSCV